ncbi:MAG: DUF5678 domain-containing protein [Actinomycetota bacterium]|nr:DUF5678 domain-containing protein [Actinomycetota bacterium]
MQRWEQRETALLSPYRGRYVALAGGEVLTAGESLEDVFGWLERHDRTADTVYRVPLDPHIDLGGFPG